MGGAGARAAGFFGGGAGAALGGGAGAAFLAGGGGAAALGGGAAFAGGEPPSEPPKDAMRPKRPLPSAAGLGGGGAAALRGGAGTAFAGGAAAFMDTRTHVSMIACACVSVDVCRKQCTSDACCWTVCDHTSLTEYTHTHTPSQSGQVQVQQACEGGAARVPALQPSWAVEPGLSSPAARVP